MYFRLKLWSLDTKVFWDLLFTYFLRFLTASFRVKVHLFDINVIKSVILILLAVILILLVNTKQQHKYEADLVIPLFCFSACIWQLYTNNVLPMAIQWEHSQVSEVFKNHLFLGLSVYHPQSNSHTLQNLLISHRTADFLLNCHYGTKVCPSRSFSIVEYFTCTFYICQMTEGN